MSKQVPSAVSIVIMGKDYKIACDPDEQDDLIEAAQQLDTQMRKMRDTGKVNGADRIAVMVALNLAHELQVVKAQNAALNENLRSHIAGMRDKIENVLEKR